MAYWELQNFIRSFYGSAAFERSVTHKRFETFITTLRHTACVSNANARADNVWMYI